MDTYFYYLFSSFIPAFIFSMNRGVPSVVPNRMSAIKKTWNILKRDIRYFVLFFMLGLLSYGALTFDFSLLWSQIVLTFFAGLLTQYFWIKVIVRMNGGYFYSYKYFFFLIKKLRFFMNRLLGIKSEESAAYTKKKDALYSSHVVGIGYKSLLSCFITCFGIAFLLRSNNLWVHPLAVFISINSKFLIQYKNRHFFNPSALGLVSILLLFDNSWISPGQWGSGTAIAVWITAFGAFITQMMTMGSEDKRTFSIKKQIVYPQNAKEKKGFFLKEAVRKKKWILQYVTGLINWFCQRIGISWFFLLFYLGGLWIRNTYLGYEIEILYHTALNGSLLLFSFFMISDPKTSPDHFVGKIIFSFLVAMVALVFHYYFYKTNGFVYVLTGLAWFVPVLNQYFKAVPWQWGQRA